MPTDSQEQINSYNSGVIRAEHKKLVYATAAGTIFEWYDFYLYGSLTPIISKQFFSNVDESIGFVLALLAFAAGFLIRPIGALIFGRLGDLYGRQYVFLLTIMLMGTATFLVGLLPSYASIGILAPIILIVLRLLQGLALGGEYGSAVAYVAEHAPPQMCGAYTGWIQTTATIGLLLSLLVIATIRSITGSQFDEWGWRLPFLLSLFLLLISVWVRFELQESTIFIHAQIARNADTPDPLVESFFYRGNLTRVILALFGLLAGQAVVWYASQFYALFFLIKTLRVEETTASILMAIALALAAPSFVFFGRLSDQIGRKPIIMLGCVLAALTYFPIFGALTHYANPDIESAAENAPVLIITNLSTCSLQFDPFGKAQFDSECDQTRLLLAKSGVPYTLVDTSSPNLLIRIGGVELGGFDKNALVKELLNAGYPEKANPKRINYNMVILLLTILVIYVAMVYAPIAAMLVEMFPTRIRCTAMSLPYHIGNGWFGGLLPSIAFAIVSATGDIYAGLWYPVIIAISTFFIGTIFVRETNGRNIAD